MSGGIHGVKEDKRSPPLLIGPLSPAMSPFNLMSIFESRTDLLLIYESNQKQGSQHLISTCLRAVMTLKLVCVTTLENTMLMSLNSISHVSTAMH